MIYDHLQTYFKFLLDKIEGFIVKSCVTVSKKDPVRTRVFGLEGEMRNFKEYLDQLHLPKSRLY